MIDVMTVGYCEIFITAKGIYKNLPEDPLTVGVGVNSTNKMLPPCFGAPDLEGKTKISPHCQLLPFFIHPSIPTKLPEQSLGRRADRGKGQSQAGVDPLHTWSHGSCMPVA